MQLWLRRTLVLQCYIEQVRILQGRFITFLSMIIQLHEDFLLLAFAQSAIG